MKTYLKIPFFLLKSQCSLTLSPPNPVLNPFPYPHGVLAPNLSKFFDKYLQTSANIAHKKSLLGKYFSESDCRSPRHDGHNWLIPETSLSDPSCEDRNARTTEGMKSGSTTPNSDETIIVTSTPVKEKPPHLTFSNVETMSGETLPSETFGSPDRDKQSPSKSPDSSSNDIFNQNLQTMRNALQHSQQMQKKKRFFQQMLYSILNRCKRRKDFFNKCFKVRKTFIY